MKISIQCFWEKNLDRNDLQTVRNFDKYGQLLYYKKMLVSIITINYNNKDGLEKTIQSVKTQKFNDYEHIIVDGGSTDGSLDVIKENLSDEAYASHVSFWCSEKDGGIYPAMNKGIRNSSGDYLLMLNSGDFLCTDEVLNTASPVLKNSRDSVVYGAVDFVDNGIFCQSVGKNADCLRHDSFPHQACFIARNLHEKFGFYDEAYSIAADYDFLVKLYVSGVPFVHIPLLVACYDMSGISSQNHELCLQFNKEIQEKYFGKKETPKLSPAKIAKTIIKLILPGFITVLLRGIKSKITK